jgi:hypothetical protein
LAVDGLPNNVSPTKLKGFVAQKSSAMEVKWQTLTWVDAYLPNLASL